VGNESKIAAERGIPLNQLATEIDEARSGDEGLARAIRVFILQHDRSLKSRPDRRMTNSSQTPDLTIALTTEVPAGFCVVLAYSFFMEKNAKTSVLYNATCPVCSFEIERYARYAGANDLAIRFDDLNSDARERWALDADTAARRLYVLHDSTLTSGIPAFLVLWTQMPRYRWLATVVGFPGIRQVASLAYDHVLAPAIYRWHLRRLRLQTAQAND